MSSDISVKPDDKYKEIFVNLFAGGYRNGYFEYELITETTDFTDSMKTPVFNFNKMVTKRTIQSKIIIPPVAFKETVELFKLQINEYEKVFGKIPSSQEIADKSKGSDLK